MLDCKLWTSLLSAVMWGWDCTLRVKSDIYDCLVSFELILGTILDTVGVGVCYREFIENHLLEFVNKNPGIVVYLQPRRHRTPRLVAEYRK